MVCTAVPISSKGIHQNVHCLCSAPRFNVTHRERTKIRWCTNSSNHLSRHASLKQRGSGFCCWHINNANPQWWDTDLTFCHSLTRWNGFGPKKHSNSKAHNVMVTRRWKCEGRNSGRIKDRVTVKTRPCPSLKSFLFEPNLVRGTSHVLLT